MAIVAIGVRGWALMLLMMRRYLMRLLLRSRGLLLLLRSSFAFPLFSLLSFTCRATVARIWVIQYRTEIHYNATMGAVCLVRRRTKGLFKEQSVLLGCHPISCARVGRWDENNQTAAMAKGALMTDAITAQVCIVTLRPAHQTQS